jgi:predicted metal-dependent hydrolase
VITSDYHLIRSDRCTIALIVHADGSVVVRAPKRTARAEIDAFVEQKRPWLARKLAEQSHRQPFDRALTAKEEQFISDIYRECCRHMGIAECDAPRLRIKKMTSRWGSYSSKTHTVALSAGLIETSLAAIRMVCIHELIHIRHRNHDTAFYAAMDQYQDPGWRKTKKQLQAGY